MKEGGDGYYTFVSKALKERKAGKEATKMNRNYRKWSIIVFVVFMIVLVTTYYGSKVYAQAPAKKKPPADFNPEELTPEQRAEATKHRLAKNQSLWEEKVFMREKPKVNVSGTWESIIFQDKTGNVVLDQKGSKVTGVFTREGGEEGREFLGVVSGDYLVGIVKSPAGLEAGKMIIKVKDKGKEMEGVHFQLDPPILIDWKATKVK